MNRESAGLPRCSLIHIVIVSNDPTTVGVSHYDCRFRYFRAGRSTRQRADEVHESAFVAWLVQRCVPRCKKVRLSADLGLTATPHRPADA